MWPRGHAHPLSWAAAFTGIGLLVALAAVGLVPGASSRLPPAPGGGPPESFGGRVTARVPAVPARRTGTVVPEHPVNSRLPDGTVVPVRPAGTRKDGTLAVPDDIRLAGWWRGGSRLGDPFGATVLAAHVDSLTQGLGPYASLLSVRPGDPVELSSAHLTQTFAVVSLQLVPRATLGRHDEIFSARGPQRLVMITCAGPYLAARGGYQNLAIVTARPVGAVARKDGP